MREPVRSGASDPGRTTSSNRAGERTAERALGGAPAWTPPTGLPDVYIAMGQTAENVVEYKGVTREEMDE